MEVSHVNFGKLEENDVVERSAIIFVVVVVVVVVVVAIMIFEVSDYFLTDPIIYISKEVYAKFSVQLCFRGM